MSLEQLRGKTLVVKYGGNAMIDAKLKRSFASDVVELANHGIRVVVVHGGGPQINEMLARLSIESSFAGGFRVTDSKTMDVVQMVLGGAVQPEIVSLIHQAGGRAVGISGIDAALLECERREVIVDGVSTDIGLVGEVVAVNSEILTTLISASYIPVVSSFGSDGLGHVLNVNADTAAGAIAGSLAAHALIMLTDVPGLYANWPNTEEIVDELSAEGLRDLLPSLTSGMVPKMEGCLNALVLGAKSALIIDGRLEHGLLSALSSDVIQGTRIVP
ncbi:MAG TPA: acetylglutamate kinase [Candidatus Nanopelagicaceae bacterium]|nr:acetylglutamate kinase [Candidatus Nanopelagicaceae bacterium]